MRFLPQARAKFLESDSMDKDKIIQEINEINRKLAKDLDNHEELLNNIRQTCVKDVISLPGFFKLNKPDEDNRSLTFSKSFGNPDKIEKNEEHEFARRHTLVHLKSNSICTWIPKNSCSSLRYSIAVSNGAITGIGDIDWIHKNNSSFTASNKELLTANYSFVILRNPFKRLLSFYCDKLCNTGKNANDKSYEVTKSLMGTDSKTTFADFVEILWRNSSLKKANEHTQDQCDFLIYRKYHDYFALEQYKSAATGIQARTGLTLEDVRPYNTIHTSYGCSESDELSYETPAELIGKALAESRKAKAEHMYNSEMIKKVGSLYLSDILMYLKTVDNSEEEMGPWLREMC